MITSRYHVLHTKTLLWKPAPFRSAATRWRMDSRLIGEVSEAGALRMRCHLSGLARNTCTDRRRLP